MLYFLFMLGIGVAIWVAIRICKIICKEPVINKKQIFKLFICFFICGAIYGWSLQGIMVLPENFTYEESTVTEYENVDLEVIKLIQNSDDHWIITFDNNLENPNITLYSSSVKNSYPRLSYLLTFETGESKTNWYWISISQEDYAKISAEG